MVEFLRKFQGRDIKIDRVNSIRLDKSMFFFNFIPAIAPWVMSSWVIVLFCVELASTSLSLYTLDTTTPFYPQVFPTKPTPPRCTLLSATRRSPRTFSLWGNGRSSYGLKTSTARQYSALPLLGLRYGTTPVWAKEQHFPFWG